MDIKRINEEFEQLLEEDEDIEWVYEKICDIESLPTNEDNRINMDSWI